jgi:Na+/H+ antiporter NhaD/arsenite permease-like protein
MLGSLVIFGLTYVAIASEKVDKTAAALLGACAVIFLQLVPYEVALEAVDLNVILLLVGMMMSVQILASTGLFEWIAITLARVAKGDGLRILVGLALATAILSALLDNVTTVILVAPITILLCELLELKAAPFLIIEALASNIGGTATLVGDPPNVLIASKTGLPFNAFIVNLGPPVLVSLALGTVMVLILLRPYLQVPDDLRERILRARPERAILHPHRLKRALVVFAGVLVAFFAGHALHLEPGVVALAGALVMVLVCRIDLHKVLERVEWNVVFFFIGLFMLIGALEHNGAVEALSEVILAWTGGNFALTLIAVMWFAGIASAVVDNIPLVIAMLPLLQRLVPEIGEGLGVADDPELLRTQVAEPLYWALALGACLGGNGSLVGASANVVISQIGRRNGHPISFLTFTAWGFPTMVVTLAISTVWLWIRFL